MENSNTMDKVNIDGLMQIKKEEIHYIGKAKNQLILKKKKFGLLFMHCHTNKQNL